MQPADFAQHTDTTAYKTLTSCLIECDYNDEKEVVPDQVQLTRLQYEVLRGNVGPDDLKTIKDLQNKLGVVQQRQVSCNINGRFRGNVILTDTFGVYHRRITLPYSLYHTEEARQAWDNNPIDYAEVYMIPAGVRPDKLQSDRLGRTSELTLHFEGPSLAACIELLMGLRLYCWTLEIRNVPMTDQIADTLQKRLRNKCPNLATLKRT